MSHWRCSVHPPKPDYWRAVDELGFDQVALLLPSLTAAAAASAMNASTPFFYRASETVSMSSSLTNVEIPSSRSFLAVGKCR